MVRRAGEVRGGYLENVLIDDAFLSGQPIKPAAEDSPAAPGTSTRRGLPLDPLLTLAVVGWGSPRL